jgi:hypothetical protein
MIQRQNNAAVAHHRLLPKPSVSNSQQDYFGRNRKRSKIRSIVIPAKAGIQFFQFLMDAGMAKSGLFTIPSF